MVGDVGAADWEELNLVEKGQLNYGWPNAEGTCIGCGYENPVYTYSHATQPAGTGSITSVLVYTDDALGEEYQGKVFIADYTAGWIRSWILAPITRPLSASRPSTARPARRSNSSRGPTATSTN